MLLLAVFTSLWDAEAQLVTRDKRWPTRGPWMWTLPRELPALYREFNGIDFGHAHLGETLLRTQDDAEIERARIQVLDFIFSEPAVPPDEAQVAPTLVQFVWELQRSFDWTHSLHRSLYDLFATDNVEDKEGAYHEILGSYLSKPEAITFHPLDHHGKLWSWPESKSFRDRHRKFNSQIWAYHWLQGAVYDAQLMGPAANQRELVARLIEHYHGYLRRPPEDWQMMPMLMETAPEFSVRFKEAADIFDNLHMLHDNLDDVLTRPDLYPTRRAQRERLLEILAMYLHRNHSGMDRYADLHASMRGGMAHRDDVDVAPKHPPAMAKERHGPIRPAEVPGGTAADPDAAAHGPLPDDIPSGERHVNGEHSKSTRDLRKDAEKLGSQTHPHGDASTSKAGVDRARPGASSGMTATSHVGMHDMGPRPPSARDVLEGRAHGGEAAKGEAAAADGTTPARRENMLHHGAGNGS